MKMGYNMSTLVAREIIKPAYTKLIGCDTETSGTKPWKHGIVEIGAILVDLDGNQKDIYQAYCNPGDVEYDPIALKINNLTIDFIKAQRPIREVLIEFIAWMDKNLELSNKDSKVGIVGNNFGFDSWFFQYAFDKHVPELDYKTKWMFRRIIEMKGFVNAILPQYPHMAQTKLGTLLNIDNENAHGAIGDAKQMLELYLHLMSINERRILLDYENMKSETK